MAEALQPAANAIEIRIEEIAQLGLLRRFHTGQRIIAGGDASGSIFFLQGGMVSVKRTDGLRLATLVPGMAFGEMALVDQSPRAASAIAETDTELLPVNRDDFLSMVRTTPAFAVSLLRSLAQRLRRMTARQA